MKPSEGNRRDFLKTTVVAATTLEVAATVQGGDASAAEGLPSRALGKTGERICIIGLGGHHIGAIKEEQEAIKLMHTAIDEGLTFFDSAWEYHDGRSEILQGKALATEGRRKKVFLMTKNCGRDAAQTRKCLDDSLRRLQTDYLDLWMFHEINYDNDPAWVVEKGALAEAVKAQQQGKVRFLGFTGHKSPHIHLEMLAVYPWDAVLMPINVCDYFYRSFAQQVLPKANQRGIAALGMKSLGGGSDQKGHFVGEKVCTAEEARRYALSQPIASLVCGIDSLDILKQDVALARNFKAMSMDEQQALRARVQSVASDGRHERFKSTQLFDSDHHRKQHSFAPQEQPA